MGWSAWLVYNFPSFCHWLAPKFKSTTFVPIVWWKEKSRFQAFPNLHKGQKWVMLAAHQISSCRFVSLTQHKHGVLESHVSSCFMSSHNTISLILHYWITLSCSDQLHLWALFWRTMESCENRSNSCDFFKAPHANQFIKMSLAFWDLYLSYKLRIYHPKRPQFGPQMLTK